MFIFIAIGVLQGFFGITTSTPISENVHEKISSSNSDKCILPPYPPHGFYELHGVPYSVPGQAFDSVAYNLICLRDYEVLGRRERFCVKGVWSEDVGKCVRFCKLTLDPTIDYTCLDIRDDVITSRPCQDREPDGTTVLLNCRSPINSMLPQMHCIQGDWDYTPICATKSNITTVLEERASLEKETTGNVYSTTNSDKIGPVLGVKTPPVILPYFLFPKIFPEIDSDKIRTALNGKVPPIIFPQFLSEISKFLPENAIPSNQLPQMPLGNHGSQLTPISIEILPPKNIESETSTSQDFLLRTTKDSVTEIFEVTPSTDFPSTTNDNSFTTLGSQVVTPPPIGTKVTSSPESKVTKIPNISKTSELISSVATSESSPTSFVTRVSNITSSTKRNRVSKPNRKGPQDSTITESPNHYLPPYTSSSLDAKTGDTSSNSVTEIPQITPSLHVAKIPPITTSLSNTTVTSTKDASSSTSSPQSSFHTFTQSPNIKVTLKYKVSSSPTVASSSLSNSLTTSTSPSVDSSSYKVVSDSEVTTTDVTESDWSFEDDEGGDDDGEVTTYTPMN